MVFRDAHQTRVAGPLGAGRRTRRNRSSAAQRSAAHRDVEARRGSFSGCSSWSGRCAVVLRDHHHWKDSRRHQRGRRGGDNCSCSRRRGRDARAH